MLVRPNIIRSGFFGMEASHFGKKLKIVVRILRLLRLM